MSLNPEVASLVKSLVLNFNQDNKASAPPNQAKAGATSLPVSTVSPPVHFNRSPISNSPEQDHNEVPMRPDIGSSRMQGPPFMPGERCPPPHNGIRPRGPPPMRLPGGHMPYRHPQYPSDVAPPPRFTRGSIPPPPFRGPPPPMYGGGRPPMNGPSGGRRGGRIEQICKFFQQGNCRNGNNCHFLHPGYQPPNW